MDWYAWLCKAGLHPDVALEYALLFARNELGAADVRHRSARSLLGRLRSSLPRGGRDRAAAVLAAPRLMQAPMPLRHSGGRVAHWNRIASSSPVARRGGGKLPLPLLAHGSKPMLTDSGGKRRNSTTTTTMVKAAPAPAAAIAGCLVTPEVCSCDEDDDGEEEEMDGGEEEMRWESMFQYLKPT